MTMRNRRRWSENQRTSTQRIGGPERVYDADPKPDTARRPVGFGVTPQRVEVDPLLWEGDQA